uniref:Putative secreted protein n=1 Tax=Ixodes ricinus TaxID=34613 RepID=A0A6B0UDN4_IXORI
MRKSRFSCLSLAVALSFILLDLFIATCLSSSLKYSHLVCNERSLASVYFSNSPFTLETNCSSFRSLALSFQSSQVKLFVLRALLPNVAVTKQWSVK